MPASAPRPRMRGGRGRSEVVTPPRTGGQRTTPVRALFLALLQNIPVVEIEALLHGHTAVHMAAIVAMPDPRLSERACIFVLPRPEQTITFDEMRRFLEAQRVAPAYLSKRLV